MKFISTLFFIAFFLGLHPSLSAAEKQEAPERTEELTVAIHVPSSSELLEQARNFTFLAPSHNPGHPAAIFKFLVSTQLLTPKTMILRKSLEAYHELVAIWVSMNLTEDRPMKAPEPKALYDFFQEKTLTPPIQETIQGMLPFLRVLSKKIELTESEKSMKVIIPIHEVILSQLTLSLEDDTAFKDSDQELLFQELRAVQLRLPREFDTSEEAEASRDEVRYMIESKLLEAYKIILGQALNRTPNFAEARKYLKSLYRPMHTLSLEDDLASKLPFWALLYFHKDLPVPDGSNFFLESEDSGRITFRFTEMTEEESAAQATDAAAPASESLDPNRHRNSNGSEK